MSASSMPKLEVGNIWTEVDDPSGKILELVNEYEKNLMGGLGLFNKDGRILSGLVPILQRQVRMSVVVNDNNIELKPIPTWVDRYYQRDAVEAVHAFRRGVIRIPTGGGKTMVASGILASVPCRWLYLVHKSNLVESAAETFERLLKEKVGRVHGYANDFDHRIVCATFKSLFLRPELLKLIQSVEGVLVDEAHTLPAKEAFAVVLNTINARFRVGLGATPFFREDRRDVHTVALLGPEIYSIEPSELAAKGYLVLPDVEWLTCKQADVNEKYPEAYQILISNSLKRNKLLVEKILQAPKPAIVFVKILEHQHKVVELFKKHGAKSLAFVRGDTPLAARQFIVESMKNNQVDIVVSSSVFNEGMDAPNLRTVLNATASSAWISSIQEPGRGTRPSHGKSTFKMYDFNDVGNRWFEKHTAERYAAYSAAGFKVPCPSALAKRTLDSIAERSSMMSAKASTPAATPDWKYWIYFGLFLGVIALLQNCLNH